MTREEQRTAQIMEIASLRYEDCEKYSAFISGAMWADNNPTKDIINLNNIWHDASEEPLLDQWFLAQIGNNAFDTFVMAMDKNKDYREWSKGINIKRWAYISDLLPKEGEV